MLFQVESLVFSSTGAWKWKTWGRFRRFHREQGQAAGLTILDFSVLAAPVELGPRSFALTGLDDLPEDLRETVARIITAPPVNRFLKVFTFYSLPARPIPLTYVQSLPALTHAV